MKATTLLERQHRDLQQVCDAVERGSPNVRQSLLPQLAGDLAAHIAIEAEVFYPAVCATLQDDSWLVSSRGRHGQVSQALDRVLDAAVDADEFARAMSDLRKMVDLHAEEEERLLFPLLEHALDPDSMRELSLAMLTMYHAKVEAGYAREPRARAPRTDVARP